MNKQESDGFLNRPITFKVGNMTREEIREYLRQPATSEQLNQAFAVSAKPSTPEGV